MNTIHYDIWIRYATTCDYDTLRYMNTIHYDLWIRYTTTHEYDTLRYINTIHYDLWLRYTTIYEYDTLRPMNTIHYEVWVRSTVRYKYGTIRATTMEYSYVTQYLVTKCKKHYIIIFEKLLSWIQRSNNLTVIDRFIHLRYLPFPLGFV